MTAGKLPLANASTPHTKSSSRACEVGRIVAQRQHLMARAAELRERQASSKVIENVQQLLTRWWSGANWRAREELLKTADWFLQLEEKH